MLSPIVYACPHHGAHAMPHRHWSMWLMGSLACSVAGVAVCLMRILQIAQPERPISKALRGLRASAGSHWDKARSHVDALRTRTWLQQSPIALTEGDSLSPAQNLPASAPITEAKRPLCLRLAKQHPEQARQVLKTASRGRSTPIRCGHHRPTPDGGRPLRLTTEDH